MRLTDFRGAEQRPTLRGGTLPAGRAERGERSDEALTVRIATDFEELRACADKWAVLHSRSKDADLFQDFRWLDCWWRSFGSGYRVFTPLVFFGEELVGILPLALRGRSLRFIGHSVADYNHVIAAETDLEGVVLACLDALNSRASEWDELLLENLPASSTFAQVLVRMQPSFKGRMAIAQGDPCPTILLAEKKEETLRALLRKEQLRRAVKKVGRRGAIDFLHIEDSGALAKHLPLFAQQHIRRSALMGRRSRFIDQSYYGFFEKLCTCIDLTKEFRFAVLEVGGEPAAYQFGIMFRSKYLYYKPTFDVDLWDLSPGQALLWYLLDHARNEPVAEFDFGQGGESYKFRYANHTRGNLNIRLYAPSIRGRYRRVRYGALALTKAAIRSDARLAKCAAALKKWKEEGFRGAREPVGAFGVPKPSRRAGGVECLVVSAGDGRSTGAAASSGSVVPQLLADLADIAVSQPALAARVAREARERLRGGQKAWLVSGVRNRRAIAWTRLRGDMAGRVEATGREDLLVVDVWPLVDGWTKRDSADVVRVLLGGTTGGAQAVVPRILLPAKSRLSALGLLAQGYVTLSREAADWDGGGEEL